MTEKHPGQGATTVVVALSAVVMTLDISIVNVALPAIRSELGTSLTSAQWIVNAYVLAFAALLLTVGAISDRTGRRGIFLAGHALFFISSATAAAAVGDVMLIIARGAQGIGAAMVFGTCLAMLSDVFRDDDAGRTRAVAAFMAAGAASAALGPLIGGALVDAAGWRWIFAINLPIGVAVMVLTAMRVPSVVLENRHLSHIDPLSTALAVGGLFALNYGILTGPDAGWSSTTIILSLTIAVLALAALAARQIMQRDRAMIDLGLFRIPTFTAATYLGFAVRIFSFGMYPFLTFWLAGVHGMSPLQIGLVLLSVAVPMIAAPPVSSMISRHISVSTLMAASMALVGVGMGWGAFALHGNPSWTAIIGPLIVTGMGAGLSMPHLMDLAVRVAPPGKAGAASGIANTAFPLGTATGVAIYGAIMHSRIDDALRAPGNAYEAAYTAQLKSLDPAIADIVRIAYANGLHWVFMVSCGVAAVSALICWFAINPQRDTPRTPNEQN